MKDFKDWLLSEKELDEKAYNEKDDVDKVALANEYNVYLRDKQKEAIENKASKEDLVSLQSAIDKSNQSTMKAIGDIGLTLKAMGEKRGVNVEDMEKSELLKFIEKTADSYDAKGKPTTSISKEESVIQLKTKQMFSEITKAAALMTTANITGVHGSAPDWSPLFGNYIDPELYKDPRPEPTIMNYITVRFAPGTENIYWNERTNEEGDAEWIGEGNSKPLVSTDYETKSIKTAELAVFWKFTTRLLFHAPSVVSDITDHATELMNEKLPDGFLNGLGSSNEPKGITKYASAWVGSGALASSVKCPNFYDAILAGFTAIRKAKHKGRVVAIVPESVGFQLKTLKDGNSQYLRVPYVSEDGSKVDRVDLVFDDSIASGKILIGVLSNYRGIISEELVYAEGYEGDDFRKNLISRRLETYANGYLPANLVTSVIYDDIATILSDIDNGEDCCCGGCGCDDDGDDGVD